jgi:hypothetical protein
MLAHPPCVDVTPLLQFTACQRLCVGGQEFDDRAAPAVPQLTQLTYLKWDCSRDYDNLTCLTRVGLAKLTALTGLQELHLTEQPNEVDMTIIAKPVGFLPDMELKVPQDLIASEQVSYTAYVAALSSAIIVLASHHQDSGTHD